MASKIADQNERSIFVGQISHNASATDLVNLFKEYGTITHTKIKQDPTGNRLNYGFVTFSDKSEARRVLNLSETEKRKLQCHGKQFHVSRAFLKNSNVQLQREYVPPVTPSGVNKQQQNFTFSPPQPPPSLFSVTPFAGGSPVAPPPPPPPFYSPSPVPLLVQQQQPPPMMGTPPMFYSPTTTTAMPPTPMMVFHNYVNDFNSRLNMYPPQQQPQPPPMMFNVYYPCPRM